MQDNWSGIPATEIDRVWPEVFSLLAAACKTSNGRMTTQVLHQDLKDGAMQLWLAHNEAGISACFVTQIIDYPAAKYCKIVIGTGKTRHRWQHHVKVVEAWAKEQGCTGMESIARAGWQRVFKDWKRTHVFLEKTFD